MKIPVWFRSIAWGALSLTALVPQGHCQIAGHVTLTVPSGYSFMANPFDASDNHLASVFSSSSPPLGTKVYYWNVTNQAYVPSVYQSAGWSTNFDIPPGIGFVTLSTSAWSAVFNGMIQEGSHTNFYAGDGKFSLLSSYFPLSNALATTGITFPELEGENVYLFTNSTATFSEAYTCYPGYGWYDPKGLVDASGPIIGFAQSFFAQNLGPSTNWVQTYSFAGSGAKASRQENAGVTLQAIQTTRDTVALSVLNPGKATYNVEVSPDGMAWTTLAANQTGTKWTGPLPAGSQVFYRVVNP